MELLGGLGMLGYFFNNKVNQDKLNHNKDKQEKNKPDLNTTNIYSTDNYNKVEKRKAELAKKRFTEKNIVMPYNSNRRSRQDILDSEFSDEDQDVPQGDARHEQGGQSPGIYKQPVEHYGNAQNTNHYGNALNTNHYGNDINLNDPECFIRAGDRLTSLTPINGPIYNDNNKHKNDFLNQFQPLTFDNKGKPVALNSIPSVEADKAREMERNLNYRNNYSSFDQNKDMTFGITDKENFVHNNMKPNFKSATYGDNVQQREQLDILHQRKMEHFTGSANNLDYRPRTERRPLFNPEYTKDSTNPYGTPVMTDVFESRYIPGSEKRNEKLFQEERVTPGLNLGYNEIGKQGFHDTFRVLPRGTNELRTADKPKISYSTCPINGMKGTKGPVPSQVFKRAPVTFRENSVKDNLPSMGYIKAQTARDQFQVENIATVNRGAIETFYQGGAKLYNDQLVPESMKEIVQEANRENFLQAEPSNVIGTDAPNARGFDKSYDPKLTQRMVEQNYIGPAGVNEIGKTYALDLTNATPDATGRNIYNSDRTGGVGNGEYNKIYTYDNKNAIPDINNRNIHNSDRIGGLNNSQFNKNYTLDTKNAIPDINYRNIHNSDRIGGVDNPEYTKPYVYDYYNAIQDLTKRDQHNSERSAGGLGTAELDKNYVLDIYNATQDLTKRDQHKSDRAAGGLGIGEHSKHNVFDELNMIVDATRRDQHKHDIKGGAGNGEFSKGYALDIKNATPDATKRDQHKHDIKGGAGNGEFSKGYAFDTINAIQDPTKRDQHKHNRKGGAGNGEFSKGYALDVKNAIPDATRRDQHKHDRKGGVGFHEFQTSRGAENNSRVNIEREKIAAGRRPTSSKYSKGPTMDGTMVRLVEPIQINRELYPENYDTAERVDPHLTKDKHTLPYQTWHFYSHVDDNLQGNAYVNNIIHKSDY